MRKEEVKENVWYYYTTKDNVLTMVLKENGIFYERNGHPIEVTDESMLMPIKSANYRNYQSKNNNRNGKMVRNYR